MKRLTRLLTVLTVVAAAVSGWTLSAKANHFLFMLAYECWGEFSSCREILSRWANEVTAHATAFLRNRTGTRLRPQSPGGPSKTPAGIVPQLEQFPA